MYTLDTNILIYQAADNPTVVDFLDQHRYEIFYVPSIVVTEFLSYPLMTPDAAERFQSFIRQTILVNLDTPSRNARRTYGGRIILPSRMPSLRLLLS